MDNQTIEELAQFCADQYYRFDAEQWLEKTATYRCIPIALAKYLSGTSWYGHSEQLDSISTIARANLTGETDAGSSNAQEAIDIARFSGIIRFRIAQMRPQGTKGDLQPNTH